MGINQASQLPGLDEVLHVRAFCKLETSCRGWILESTVNTVTNANNNNDTQSIRVFERYHSLFSPAWNSYWELLSVGPKTNISCVSNIICWTHLRDFLNSRVAGSWGLTSELRIQWLLVWAKSLLFLAPVLAAESYTCPKWGHYRTSGDKPQHSQGPFLRATVQGSLQWVCRERHRRGKGTQVCSVRQTGLRNLSLEAFFYASFCIEN